MPFEYVDPDPLPTLPPGMRFTCELWAAINAYTESCGGDTSARTVSERRMNAVAAVEAVIRQEQQEPVATRHLLPTLQLAYRKHAMDDDTVGWDELEQVMLTALTEAMGDPAFQCWLATVRTLRDRRRGG